MSQVFRRPSTGFTLIELLVAVSIIAVLISLLIPAMAQSKEMAKRSACLSNLRQQAIAASSYADIYKEVIPVGYVTGYKQFNYLMWYDAGVAGQTAPLCWGLLVSSGLLPPPGAYYCPSMSAASLQYNTATNPCPVWPVTATSQTAMRGGYSVRPTANWSHLTSTAWYPVAPAPWPKRHTLAGKALSMDFLIEAAGLSVVHVTGVNAAYENGSARFVPAKVLQAAGLGTIGSTFSVGENSKMDALWAAIDAN